MDIRSARGRSRPRASLSIGLLCVLIVGGMAATTNAQVFALLLAPIASEFGMSVAQLGGLRTLEEIVAISTGLALTPYVDRTSRKHLLLAGFALMALAASIAAVSVSPWMIAGYFIVDGVSKIFLFSALLAIPGDLTSGPELDRTLGFVIGSFALSGFTIIPIVGFAAEQFSWRAGYAIAMSTAAVAFALATMLIPRTYPVSVHHDPPLRQLVIIARLPGLVPGLIGALMRFVMYASVLTYSGAFLIEHHGINVARASLYISLGAASFLVASVLSGFLLRFIGVSWTLIGGGILVTLCVLAAYGFDAPLMIAGLALIATAGLMGMLENASTGLLLRLAPAHRGAAMTLNELGAAAGTLIGIGSGAVALRIAGFAGIGFVLSVVGILAAAFTLVAIRTGSAFHVVSTGSANN